MKPIFMMFQRRRFASSRPRFQTIDPISPQPPCALTPSQHKAQLRFFGYLAFFGVALTYQLISVPLQLTLASRARHAALHKDKASPEKEPAQSGNALESPSPSSASKIEPHRSQRRTRCSGGFWINEFGDLKAARMFGLRSFSRGLATTSRIDYVDHAATLMPPYSETALRELCALMERDNVSMADVKHTWSKYQEFKNTSQNALTKKTLQQAITFFYKSFKSLNNSKFEFVESAITFDRYARILIKDMLSHNFILSHPEDAYELLHIPNANTAFEHLTTLLGPDHTCMFTHPVHRIDKIFASIITQLCSKDMIADALRVYAVFASIRFPERISRREMVPATPLVIALMKFGDGKKAVDLLRDIATHRVKKVASPAFSKADLTTAALFSRREYTTEVDEIWSVTPIALEMLFEMWSSLGNWKDVLKTFQKIKDEGITRVVPMPERVVHLILKAQIEGKHGGLMTVDSIIDLVKGLRDERSLRKLFNFGVQGFADMGKMKEAEALRVTMQERGVAPDLITFTSLITGYTRLKHIRSAMELHAEALSLGMKPDLVHASVIVKGLAHAGYVKEATNVYIKMLEGRIAHAPVDSEAPMSVNYIDAVLSTSILTHLICAKRSPKKVTAFDMTFKLVRSGDIVADGKLLDVLLQYYIYERQYIRVLKIIRHIRSTRLSLHPSTLDTVILALIRDGRPKRAVAFAHLAMRETGACLSVKCIRTLAYCFRDTRDVASLVWLSMYAVRSGRAVENDIDVDIFNTLVMCGAYEYAHEFAAEVLRKWVAVKRLEKGRRRFESLENEHELMAYVKPESVGMGKVEGALSYENGGGVVRPTRRIPHLAQRYFGSRA
ncbi:hypothetical protein BC829DRAFT_441269 [Chytridium lagenaria]|nr:hypothetical protein BC829DRAFT_441269 [Chytridium lagenaria]